MTPRPRAWPVSVSSRGCRAAVAQGAGVGRRADPGLPGRGRAEGIAGAPFTIYYGEVSGDWASEYQRQPSGVRSALVFNPANQEAGPDCEFAVALR
jgi:hypothetical protein